MALRERARKAEDKEQRRRAFLDAARTLFAERGWAGFAMADVAAATGLVKGTLYLYWPTKEELLLAVLEELLWQWLDELDARFDDARAPAAPRKLAALVCDSLASYEPLGRLLAVLQTVLEHNVSKESIRASRASWPRAWRRRGRASSSMYRRWRRGRGCARCCT